MNSHSPLFRGYIWKGDGSYVGTITWLTHANEPSMAPEKESAFVS